MVIAGSQRGQVREVARLPLATSRLVTSFLDQGLADRVICSISPRVIGAGVEAVNAVGAGLRLDDTMVTKVGGEIVLAGDVVPAARQDAGAPGPPGRGRVTCAR